MPPEVGVSELSPWFRDPGQATQSYMVKDACTAAGRYKLIGPLLTKAHLAIFSFRAALKAVASANSGAEAVENRIVSVAPGRSTSEKSCSISNNGDIAKRGLTRLTLTGVLPTFRKK